MQNPSDVQQGQPFISLGPEVCELLKIFGVTDAERTSRVVIDFKAGDIVTITVYQNALFPQLEKVKELIEKFNIIKKEGHVEFVDEVRKANIDLKRRGDQ